MCAWEGKHTYKYMCMLIIKRPLSPCSISMLDCHSPSFGDWLQRDVGTQVLPPRVGWCGWLWAGNSCRSCLEWHRLA